MLISTKIRNKPPPPDELSSAGPKSFPRRARAPASGRAVLTLLLLAQMTLLQVANAACSDPTTLTAPSNPSAYTYIIGSGAYTWTVPAYTQGTDCTFTEILTMSPSAAWISISGRVITVTSTDTALHNTSTSFTVTSTIDDTSSTNNNSYTFTITLSNPCKTATLNTPSVSTITVKDGYSNTGTFTDVADSYYTDYGDASFCGTRTFTLTDSGGSSVSWLSVALTSGTTYTITAAPTSTNTELQATHTITLTVASSTYSSDISSVSTTFSVVVADPCSDPTTLTAPSNPSAYTYIIGTGNY